MKTSKYMPLYLLGGAAVGGVVLWLIFRKKEENTYSDNSPHGRDYVKKIAGNTPAPYLTELERFAADRTLVSRLAQDLHDAMKYNGTDEEKIFKTLENLDENQFKIVYDRFGLRADTTWFMPVKGGKKANLQEWLQAELSESLYNQLKEKYPKYL